MLLDELRLANWDLRQETGRWDATGCIRNACYWAVGFSDWAAVRLE